MLWNDNDTTIMKHPRHATCCWSFCCWSTCAKYAAVVCGVLFLTLGFGGPAWSQDVVEVQAAQAVIEVQVDDVENDHLMIVDGVFGFDEDGPRDPEKAKESLVSELKTILKPELYFLFVVVDVEQPLKKQICSEAETSLNNLTDMLVNENEGVRLFGGIGQQSTVVAMTSQGLSLNANPYQRVSKEVMKVAEKHLSPEKIATYKEEVEKRNRFRLDACVGMVVHVLDQRLSLTVQQRDELHKNLVERWPDAINTSIDNYLSNADYVPVVPFPLIDKILNRNQRTVWKTLNQYAFPMDIGNIEIAMDWDLK